MQTKYIYLDGVKKRICVLYNFKDIKEYEEMHKKIKKQLVSTKKQKINIKNTGGFCAPHRMMVGDQRVSLLIALYNKDVLTVSHECTHAAWCLVDEMKLPQKDQEETLATAVGQLTQEVYRVTRR